MIIGILIDIAITSITRPKLSSRSTHLSTEKPANTSTKLIEIAKKRASIENNIIISYFDLPFLKMALNFYETSLKRLNISNFIFATSHYQCCLILNELSENCCIVYKSIESSSNASEFGHKSFAKKSNIRNGLIIQLLNAEMNVLYSDIDVYFAKNPFEHINCSDCDIATQMDENGLNSGFVYVRPTIYGKEIYAKMNQLTASNDEQRNQPYLHQVVYNLQISSRNFKYVKLPMNTFLCGKFYFQSRNFVDDNPCKDCVQIHNNYIVSIEAKEYRAKETGLWDYDGEQYFSDPFRKYIVFDNPYIIRNSSSQTEKEEHKSLISALAIGAILNRTLILPSFHCKSQPCSLLSRYRLQNFYAHFGNKFREHSFLKHLKVPATVKQSRSKIFAIVTQGAKEIFEKNKNHITENITYLTPKNVNKGATDTDIINWFERETSSILQFHSLYSAFYRFNDEAKQNYFARKISDGLRN